MDRRLKALMVVAGLCVMALVLSATPAHAQMGSLRGKIVDEQGKPVPDAEVSLDFTGEQKMHLVVKTDKNGEWVRAGLVAAGGRWTITAKKGNLTGTRPNFEVALGGAQIVPDIVIRASAAAGGGNAEASKKAAELKKLDADVNAALAANNYDAAIAKLTEATGKIDKCAACYVKLGDVYTKQQAYDKAEEAYKQAVTFDEKSADAYEGMSVLYNTTKKFDQAAQASAKAQDLRAAGGGPGDATSAYNAGVIFWNQGKIPEAKAQFEKALQMNATMADAQYYFGMCLVNEGKVAEAKAALETYLKLAPSGANAPTAKAILDSMK
jgi:tetratricopeptide (TPR) repeat protein